MATTLGCCLCGLEVADRRKKRRLHGSSCCALKMQLQSLSSIPLDDLAETADGEAFLCYCCENQLASIGSLEKKVRDLKSNIVGKLSKLHSVHPVVLAPSSSSRKRRLDPGDHQPTGKRAHLVDEELSECQSLDEPEVHPSATAGPSTSPQVQVSVLWDFHIKVIIVVCKSNQFFFNEVPLIL